MSIKDFFNNKGNPKKILVSKSQKSLGEEIESADYLRAFEKDKYRFVPNIDFSNPENFAHYGSAETYYKNSIERIYKTYPYDGSLYERTAWFNSSSYLDLHIFENEYPRTNGFVNFSPAGHGSVASMRSSGSGVSHADYALPSTVEYILVKGGPHKDANHTSKKKIFPGDKNQFLPGASTGTANVYSTGSNQESNLKFDLDEGITVEFWLKKEAHVSVASSGSFETIFDLWNTTTGSSNSRGQFTVFTHTSETATTDDPFKIRIVSGSTEKFMTPFSNIQKQDTFDGNWHHYAFTAYNQGTNLVSEAYLDGKFKNRVSYSGFAINEVTGALQATIGSLITVDGGDDQKGYNKLSGSIDEFRFWKTRRTAEEIGKNWFSQVYGGANKDSANSNLGVYFKFNEGVTGTSSTDSTILDYSGRLSNGTFTGYSSTSRNTGSAMVLSGKAASEFKDPIIYSGHSDVSTYKTNMESKGKEYDQRNNASIFYSLPSWMVDEDRVMGNDHIRNLTQIMATYFDDLHQQIKHLPTIKEVGYVSSSVTGSSLPKPRPFNKQLLQSSGLTVNELFVNADVLNEIASRDNDREFSEKLHNIKNLIYKNIYNNLSYIYKSKGTEKAFRNAIRSFGVGEELVKINTYGNNTTYEFKDNYKADAIRKKYVDFNHTNRFAGTVYQMTSSGVTNSVSYITGSAVNNYEGDGIATTVEAEVIFPRKTEVGDNAYFDTPFTRVSLFGAHTAKSGSDTGDATWNDPDLYNFQVFAIRDKEESKHAYFMLSGSYLGAVSSSLYWDVYDNEKWNFAVRIKPKTWPWSSQVTGTLNQNYDLEFHGVNINAGVVQNQFTVSGTVSNSVAKNMLKQSKRLYIGAERANFTGSVTYYSDARISSLRYWNDYLDNSVIKAHALDPENFGTLHPYRNAFLFQSGSTGRASEKRTFNIPQIKTLALHWSFNQLTSSDAGITGDSEVPDAGFDVSDLTSGSLTNEYYWLEHINTKHHTGRGYGFLPAQTNVVNLDFVPSYKQTLPEIVQSSDMVNILQRDDEIFTRDTRPINYYMSIEKNMYQTISEEMLNMFATIVDFNNLVGEPVHKYRHEYKDLVKLKELFYDRVDNTPDLDRFVEYYKWIDSSLNIILQQLIPASADVSENISNVVESHLLERNKYQHKFPTLEFKKAEPEGHVKSINELKYNWKLGQPTNLSGASPVFGSDSPDSAASLNTTWFKERAERDNSDLSINSGDSNVDSDRNSILRVATTTVSGSSYATRRLTRVYDVYATSSLSASTVDHINGRGRNIRPILNSIKNVQLSSSVLMGSSGYLQHHVTDPHSSSILSTWKKSNPSGTMWNYNKNYEIVQTSGRSVNNRYFVDSDGAISGNINTLVIETPDFALPARGTNDSVFVNRFSAPGGPEVMSRGYLDTVAEEYSVYNSMNNRNLTVRLPLRDLLSNAAEQFGSSSTGPSAAYHKTNRNKFYRMAGNETTIIDVADNAYVTYQIPRSDLQYQWITASAHSIVLSASTDNVTAGHAGAYTWYLNQTSNPPFTYQKLNRDHASLASTDIVIVSGSEWRAYYSTSNNKVWLGHNESSLPGSRVPFAHTDYLGMNTIIMDGVSGSDNTLGYPSMHAVHNPLGVGTQYYSNNYLNDALFAGTYDIEAGAAGTTNKGYVGTLNSILLNRAGPYQYPSWKQTRTGEHKVAKYHRNNNILSVQDVPTQAQASTGIVVTPMRAQTFKHYTDPPVTSRSKPIVHRLDMGENEKGNKEALNLRHTYGNNFRFFGSEELNNKLGLRQTDGQVYDDVLTMYTQNIPQNPVEGLNSFTYSETVYPKEANAYLAKTRGRTSYTETAAELLAIHGQNRTFWRDNASDRDRTTSAKNSFGFAVSTGSKSVWPLDHDGRSTPTFTFEDTTGDIMGELNYSNIGTLFGGYVTQYSASSSPYVTGSVLYQRTETPQYGTSSAITSAIPYETTTLSGKNPWYDSYDDFAADIRYMAKDHTVVPEFRVSEHMNYYIENGFEAENSKFLTLEGGTHPSSSATETSGISDDFYKVYAHSDFMEHFSDIKSDHNNVANVKSITLKCEGIKKLLPYNGFYPMTRTVQLGTLLSQSVTSLSSSTINSATLTDFDSAFRQGPHETQPGKSMAMQIFARPLMAPGVLFNSIKAGIACSYPMFTGSNLPFRSTANNHGRAHATGTLNAAHPDYMSLPTCLSSAASYHIPFESLLELNKYYPIRQNMTEGQEFDYNNLESAVWMDETYYNGRSNTRSRYSNPTGSTVPVVVWGGDKKPNFELAMHNFLAEVPNFFLKNRSFKSFTSRPKSDWKKSFEPNKTYYMDVVLHKTDNFIMAEGSSVSGSALNDSTSSFGTHRGSIYGPPTRYKNDVLPHDVAPGAALSMPGTGSHIDDPAYAPYTPPYFEGKARARISFRASDVDQYADEISDFTLDTILSHAKTKVIYSNDELNSSTYDQSFPAIEGAMQISSSINLFGKTKIKKVGYSTNFGPDGRYIPVSVSDPDASEDTFDVWTISPKFECPVLNFTSSDNSVGRGMWGGYGSFPASNEGIFLSLQESYPDISNAAQSTTSGSLIEMLGFKADSKQIGEIADAHTITEAVIAVPFRDHNGERHFIQPLKAPGSVMRPEDVNLVIDSFKSTEAADALPDVFNSMRQQINLMAKYVIPPQLNFIKTEPALSAKEDKKPILMYIFEFSTRLDRQDLADIWQGVMPKPAMKAQKQISHFTHPGEVFGDQLDNTGDLRWMVFKVKRRAKKNYFAATADSYDDDRFKFQFNNQEVVPEYSYNWPYDFCSLVELAKIESSVDFEAEKEE